MQSHNFEWRIATALGSPMTTSMIGRFSPALLLPLLFVISVLVLLVAPKGTTAHWAPLAGALCLAIEFLVLARLVFRIHLAVLRLRGVETIAVASNQSRVRRCLLSAVNALFGLLVFTLMFYPVSHTVIEAARGSGAARLLWMLTVGGAIVTLAFGQMVSLLLDTLQQKTPSLAN
jgi:hypothetical protein